VKSVKALYNHLALPYLLYELDRNFCIIPAGWYITIKITNSQKKPGHFYKYKKLPLDENFWVERDCRFREKGMSGNPDIHRFCAVLL